jgi:hypothetical protein
LCKRQDKGCKFVRNLIDYCLPWSTFPTVPGTANALQGLHARHIIVTLDIHTMAALR